MKTSVANHLERLISRYPNLSTTKQAIASVYYLLEDCYRQGGKLLICGNGGSAADSEHIVGELMKSFMLKRPIPETDVAALRQHFPEEGDPLALRLHRALPAISLVGHSAFGTAYSNDVAPEMVFAQQVYGYGRPGDVLMVISTSGNSTNVINAARVARAFGLRIIGLTGQSGGKLGPLCDGLVSVPATATPDVQELHLPMYHALCAMLEEAFFGS